MDVAASMQMSKWFYVLLSNGEIWAYEVSVRDKSCTGLTLYFLFI